MTKTLSSSLSSVERRLTIRRRPDLQISEQRQGDRRWWVVKDPLGLRYFRLPESEAAILEMLDGQVSLADLKTRYQQRFAPQLITIDALYSFILSLYQWGLCISDEPGQGLPLWERSQRKHRQQTVAAWMNLLAIRFRGVDPDRFLSWLNGCLGWVFDRGSVICGGALVVAALLLVTVEFDLFVARLPAAQEFFQPVNVPWLMLALAGVKAAHELGHGLACKRFGGECHELGVMLLFFMPSLYCNVSDAWMLPNRWQRVAIAGAGIYVELVLAACATLVWWSAAPGLLSHLSLNVMLICSLNTVLLNGNPLLRYDGYFMLSSLVEIPNLAQKSSAFWLHTLQRVCLGTTVWRLPTVQEQSPRKQALIAVYGLAATTYRWLVVIFGLLAMRRLLEWHDLTILADALSLPIVASVIVVPCVRLNQALRAPGALRGWRPRRAAVVLGLAIALGCVIGLVPLPHRIIVPFTLEPQAAGRVYVTSAGLLDEVLVQPGSLVQAGQALAQLSNLEVTVDLANVESQVAEQSLLVETLRRQRVSDPTAGAQIPTAEEALLALQERRDHLRDEERRLRLIAPRAGQVLPPPEVRDRSDPANRLPVWSKTPLDPSNRGCFLETQTVFCLIADPAEREALLVIEQSDIEFAAVGQAVDLQFDALPGQNFHAQLAELSQAKLESAQKQLSSKQGGDIATRTNAAGHERPVATSYRGRVPLDGLHPALAVGARGWARIHVPRQTLGQRLWRLFQQTFQLS